jgi:hypothetical protein
LGRIFKINIILVNILIISKKLQVAAHLPALDMAARGVGMLHDVATLEINSGKALQQ